MQSSVRHMTTRRLTVIIPLLCMAVGTYWLLGAAFTGTQVSADEASSPTPVVVSDALRAELDALLDSPQLLKSRVSVEVADCESGRVVYGRDPDALMNPASNLKLLTSSAALDVLGPAFRFQTYFLHDGTFADGVLKGNLYLKGTGDPELVYEDVWKIVKELQALGLHRIEGDIIADDGYLDTVRSIPGWTEDVLDGDTQAYNPPLGALSFNFNTVAVLVRPGNKVGAPAQVSLETPTGYVRIVNEATTAKARARLTLNFRRELTPEGNIDHLGPSRETLVLDGKIPVSMRYKRYYRTITDPPRFSLTLLQEMLDKEGVKVTGAGRLGKTPEQAELLHVHYSSSLDMLMKYMNKLSSNFISEHLIKAMGAKVFGEPGTTEKGVMVVRDYLRRNKLPWDDATFVNGSGLSVETRVSAHHLVSLVCHVQQSYGARYDVLSSLPIAGIDGTMRNRMKGTPAFGRVRAKTGSVRGVFGFSGVMETLSGRTLAFSFLVNDIAGDVGAIKRTQDRWANLLVTGGSAAGAGAAGEGLEPVATLSPDGSPSGGTTPEVIDEAPAGSPQ